MASKLHPASTADTRSLDTRRPRFDYGDGLDQRHFVQGDLITSHLVAVLSTLIPMGERFVVDAVRQYRAELADENLRRQANAFVGQESMHQREHGRLNEVLHGMGDPTRTLERMGSVLFALAQRLPRNTRLGLTAALEHWTAVLAEHVLDLRRTSPPPIARIDEEVRAMVTWHLIEEIEHKSVAFDVMQSLGTTEVQRIRSMRLLTWLLGPFLGLSLLVSLATDRSAWNPAGLRRSMRWVRANSTLAQDGFARDVREWNRVGFHPDERDHEEMLDHWRAAAFGPGSLVERRSRRVAG